MILGKHLSWHLAYSQGSAHTSRHYHHQLLLLLLSWLFLLFLSFSALENVSRPLSSLSHLGRSLPVLGDTEICSDPALGSQAGLGVNQGRARASAGKPEVPCGCQAVRPELK